MSYEAFKNKETWLVEAWGLIEAIADVWIDNEAIHGDPHCNSPTNLTEQYCRDAFVMLNEEAYSQLGNGILRAYIDHSTARVDWHEVLTYVKATITERIGR
ncbi:MAG: hypothetical protein P8J32_07300 [bacterium]|nr:hypothetical protein [bacterium]